MAAELGARKSATFLRLPDKKGKPGQKALQRMDSMQFGVGPQLFLTLPCVFAITASLVKPSALSVLADTSPHSKQEMS